jgi:hypothetical protein
MKAKLSQRPAKLLHFDIENRPLAYSGQDFTTGEIISIAASWANQKKVHVWLLGLVSAEHMLSEFMELYDQADIVTGHYIRGHDLPMLNAAMLEFELPLLSPKLSSDTYLDLVKRKGVSASQENLADMYGLSALKYHMNNAKWREANRLTAKGLEYTYKRVTADIAQHKQLRKKLIEAGALKKNRMWTP